MTPRAEDSFLWTKNDNPQLFRPTSLNRAEDRAVLEERDGVPMVDRRNSLETIDSRLSETRYAVLPHGLSLEGWSEAEKEELNDHVRHLMHSKRAAFKRSMKGFGQYVRRRKHARIA